MGELFLHLDGQTKRIHEVLSRRPRGLFTDIDGTISRIAPTPEAATLLVGVAPLLQQAEATFDVVAAVSGRAARDAAALVGDDHLLYIGNHGFELYQPELGESVVAPAALPLVAALESVLDEIGQPLQERWPGLRIEPKGVTASIHVRATSEPTVALDDVYHSVLEHVARASTRLRVTRGRMMVEIRPDLAVDKGTAVLEVIREHGLRSALYLGDDRTDLDAFRALRQLTEQGACQGLSVAVQNDEAVDVAADADLVLPSIEEVPDFLRLVLSLAAR
jgi:trehalose 6-phosphate phosphatase